MPDQPHIPAQRSDPSANAFVGRRQEMIGLKSALDEARNGHPRLEMLAGEPGIGKTRLAGELALHAESQGVQVLWGSCHEGDGAPPYWPWVQPIRDYVAQTGSDQLKAEMGAGAVDIAQIVPQVLNKVPAEGQSFNIEPEQARFRLFESIARFLDRASHNKALMLVLDDLHWADQPSLLLLEFLARNLESSPILMLCAYRDIEISREHPPSETFTRLSRSPSFHRQTITGLTLEDAAGFIRSATGFAPSPELAQAVHVHTEGNPFFMGEVLRLLNERGQTQLTTTFDPALGLTLPDTVRDVVTQRLDRLSEECLQMLTTASVIGRQFGLRPLGMLTEKTTEEDLLTQVDEALEARVVTEVPDRTDRYEFSHALIQQTLVERLSTSRRVRLHARIGEALETIYRGAARRCGVRVGIPFCQSRTGFGTGQAGQIRLPGGASGTGILRP